MKELFPIKPKNSQLNSTNTALSSLNLLVSGAQMSNKPRTDEVYLKKWLHNWIYTLDKQYGLDVMTLSKEQHTEFKDLFTGKTLNFP